LTAIDEMKVREIYHIGCSWQHVDSEIPLYKC
jgi:hypothetical protein